MSAACHAGRGGTALKSRGRVPMAGRPLSTGAMTETEARAALRAFEAVADIEQWIAEQWWERLAGARTASTRISHMAGIPLARISEIWSDFQQLASSSVAAPWNTQQVNWTTGLCSSISTAA